MLTLFFIICMFSVFGRFIMLAFRGAWGMTRMIVSLVFFPIVLIGMVFSGLITFALPLLILFGAISLLVDA